MTNACQEGVAITQVLVGVRLGREPEPFKEAPRAVPLGRNFKT